MMRGIGSLLLAGVVALGLIVWHGLGREELPSYHDATGYVARVNQLIQAERLYYDCGERRIETAPDAEWPEADLDWFRKSNLPVDIDRFNRSPDAHGRYFIIDAACTLREIHPSVRNVPLPFANRAAWYGAVRYSGESGGSSSLRSQDRTIVLAPEPASEPPRSVAIGSGTPERTGEAVFHAPRAASRRAARVYTVQQEAVVEVYPQGSSLASPVRLLGFQLPTGRHVRLETGDWLHLALLGSDVEETFLYIAGRTAPLASSVRARNDARERRYDDVPLGWSLDLQTRAAVPWLEDLVSRIETGLRILPRAHAQALQESFDLQLGLRRSLHQALSQELHRFAGAQRHGSGQSVSAGISVLDAKSGDVLAMATYPWPDAAADTARDAGSRARLLQNQNLIRHPIGSAGKPFLFAAIADAHPFLLDLKVGQHGAEHAESLFCHFGVDAEREPRAYRDHPHGSKAQAVDFESALEVSCNRYTVDLLMLALAAQASPQAKGRRASLRELLPARTDLPWRARAPRLFLGNQPLDWAPDIRRYVRDREPRASEREAIARSSATRVCDTLQSAYGLPFGASLQRIAGVPLYFGRDPGAPEGADVASLYETARFDLSPLDPLLNHLERDADGEPIELNESDRLQLATAFQSVAPEAVNLKFNDMSDLRGHYVSLGLGGASSLWNNLQLSEALSRLVTGRRVQAQLVSGIVAPDAPSSAGAVRSFEALELNAAVRQRVLSGMGRVVSGAEGTGWRIRSALSKLRQQYPDREFHVFAKTGTPNFVHHVDKPVGTALRELVLGRWLRLEDGELLLRRVAEQAPYAPPESVARAAFVRALATTLAELETGASADAVLQVLDRFAPRRAQLSFPSAQAVPAKAASPLRVVDGRLEIWRGHRQYATVEHQHFGAVFIFSLVSVPKAEKKSVRSGAAAAPPIPRPEDLAHPDARALSVAIHLDAVVEDSREAVLLAAKILPDLAAAMEADGGSGVRVASGAGPAAAFGR